MSRVRWAIVEGEPWRILRFAGGGEPQATDVGPSAGPDEWRDSIVGGLKRLGYAGEPVLLGMASRSCLVVYETPQEPAWDQGGESLRYALEEHLPLAAEEFTAVLIGKKPDRLAMVLPLKDWPKRLAACESAGVDLRVIAPWVLLGVQASPRGEFYGRDLIWMASEWNRLSLVEGEVRRWQALSSDAIASLIGGRFPETVSSGDTIPFFVGTAIPDGAAGATLDTDALSMKGAAAVLDERELPWVNFRQGPLSPADPHRPYRGALRNLLVSGVGLLVLLICSLRIRASQFEAVAASFAAEQADIFREVFPNQRPPSAVRSRLDSEHRRLLIQNGPDETEQLQGAGETVVALLKAVPTSIRCRIHHVRCEGGQAAIDCEVRSLADAALLQKALSDAGFEIAPPRVELVGELVPLRLSVKRAAAVKGSRSGEPRP